MQFQPHDRRRVEADFAAGHISSDGGLVLLREVARESRLFERIASCFRDDRDQRYVEHRIRELLAQRILALLVGYEDLDDHDRLRHDPLLALAAGKDDLLGEERRAVDDRGTPLASPSSLTRLEHAPRKPVEGRRDLKIFHDPAALELLFTEFFLEAQDEPPEQIILDLDATDDPVHGDQEGRFFHGYYDCYCYLPLYIFCGDHLLVAKLRRANQDEAAGSLEEVQRVVRQIRARWPEVRILLRADSGFCRDWLMDWCEQAPGVDFVFGIAKNSRLIELVEDELSDAAELAHQTGERVRAFEERRYRTLDSWSRERRVVAKVEHIGDKSNPRFVVTSLPISEVGTAELYDEVYCARGDMENRIKEQQLGLFADRTSAATMQVNQLRLWFSSFAYVLFTAMRRTLLAGTEFARAQVWTVREKLLKVGALIKQSVRRVHIGLSKAFPYADVWRHAVSRLPAASVL